jgi:hypothetical protein
MEIDDEEMDQLPSSSSGPKGERKRFEVKKVKIRKISFVQNIDDFHFLLILSNDVSLYPCLLN